MRSTALSRLAKRQERPERQAFTMVRLTPLAASLHAGNSVAERRRAKYYLDGGFRFVESCSVAAFFVLSRLLNSAGDTMGTANALARERTSASPVTRASARAASASIRRGRSDGSRHAGNRWWRVRCDDWLAEGEIVVQKVSLLGFIEPEPGVGEDADEFGRSVPAGEGADSPRAPAAAKPRHAAGREHQGREQDVRVEDGPDRRHSPERAQRTASVTSASESSSSESFARTASARLMCTGVSTMRPFSVGHIEVLGGVYRGSGPPSGASTGSWTSAWQPSAEVPAMPGCRPGGKGWRQPSSQRSMCRAKISKSSRSSPRNRATRFRSRSR